MRFSSDRVLFPYFMRTVTPDDAQTKAMVSMLEMLGSDYVQILYSEGAYGEGGRDKVNYAGNW